MSTEQLGSLILTGITLGAVYAIMAVGLSFIYGITKIFNYAQGAFYTWAGYIAWMLSVKYFQLPYPAVVIITVVTMFFWGFAYEKLLMRPLRRLKDWDITAIIVTLGSALLLDNLARTLFTSTPRRIPSLADGSFTFAGHVITQHEVITLVAALAIVFLLALFLGKVRLGMAIKGVAQNQMGARIVGIPINKMFSYSFAISGALAGVSAILLSPKILVYPTVGWVVFIKAFVIMVFGGVGSLKGTIIAAFILAMVEAFVSFGLGGTWALPVFILILIVMLTFRPKGLFGTW